MARKSTGCELCSSEAKTFCESDQASLCWDCDEKVHSANFLVAKHTRAALCGVCQSQTPWRASGLGIGRAVVVCSACVAGSVGDPRGGSAREEIDDHGEEYSDNDGSGSSSEEESEDDDGENQVVPFAASNGEEEEELSSSGGVVGELASTSRFLHSDDEIGRASSSAKSWLVVQEEEGEEIVDVRLGRRPLKQRRVAIETQ